VNIFKRYNIKNILLTIMWIVIGSGSIALLVAAVHTKDVRHCKGLDINIHGVSNNFFIDEQDVKKIISSYTGNIEGTRIDQFNLVSMEAELKRDVWIKNAELFFDNNGVLKANVEEREPIARVFSLAGSSFYIDNTNMILPVSEKLSARLPVFTSFPSENKVLSKADSSLLNDVKKLSFLIQQDSFLMAMIEQVDITAKREFEMIPKIGDQTIVFGDASGAEQKFRKLQLFYKKVMVKYGWNRYSVINLQYKGQVIGKLKGKDDVSEDSLRTQEIMHTIALNAAMAASDSLQMIIQDNEKNTTNVSLIERSMEREDEEEHVNPFPKYLEQAAKQTAEMPAEKPVVPVVKKTAVKNNKAATKPAVKPPVKAATKPVTKPAVKAPQVKQPEKPKAVMQKKNEY
jgi:cell division protein FtsQ